MDGSKNRESVAINSRNLNNACNLNQLDCLHAV